MAFNAFDIVCRLDRDDILDEVHHNKKTKGCLWSPFGQATCTGLCWALSSRAIRVL